MLAWARKRLLATLAAGAKEVACPQCGALFHPFAGREITTFAELSHEAPCPKCGKGVALLSAIAAGKDAHINPPGPFVQPEASRIERRPVSEHELLFYLPASGKWGFWLFFALFWNLLSWTVFLAFLSVALTKREWDWITLPFTALFPAIGIALAYITLRTRFATHLLYLSPEFVRLQRTLFTRKTNHDVPTADVVHVKKAEFYSENYQPVYGIEISAGKRRIRFGTTLTEDEKNWLCWEIREFVRARGAGV